MPGVSKYERELIDALLQPNPPPIEPGTGLVIFDTSDDARRTYDIAIAPAMHAVDLNSADVSVVFDDFSSLATVARTIQTAQAIVVDISSHNAEVCYCLGLANALHRYPILITSGSDERLPFDFRALRCISYQQTMSNLLKLREQLTRALRVFLAGCANE